MRRREGRGEGGCTAINPDAVPSVHVTKMATCTGKHSIFRISRKIEECEQSTYKVNSRSSKFITFIPCALICQKLVNFLELNCEKNCIEVCLVVKSSIKSEISQFPHDFPHFVAVQ